MGYGHWKAVLQNKKGLNETVDLLVCEETAVARTNTIKQLTGAIWKNNQCKANGDIDTHSVEIWSKNICLPSQNQTTLKGTNMQILFVEPFLRVLCQVMHT